MTYIPYVDAATQEKNSYETVRRRRGNRAVLYVNNVWRVLLRDHR